MGRGLLLVLDINAISTFHEVMHKTIHISFQATLTFDLWPLDFKYAPRLLTWVMLAIN